MLQIEIFIILGGFLLLRRKVVTVSFSFLVLSAALLGCGTSSSGVHNNTSNSNTTSNSNSGTNKVSTPPTSKVQSTSSNSSSVSTTASNNSSKSSGNSGSGRPSSQDKAFVVKLQQEVKAYGSLDTSYNTIRGQSASGKITNAQFFNKIGVLIPKAENIANDIQGLQVPHDVSNSRYLKITSAVQVLSNSAQDMENGLLDMASIETSGDISKMSSANQQLQSSTKLLIKFDTELNKLGGY